MQVSGDGKRRFHSFIEFYAIHVKSRGKTLIIVARYDAACNKVTADKNKVGSCQVAFSVYVTETQKSILTLSQNICSFLRQTD